jgi:hypothetical protein
VIWLGPATAAGARHDLAAQPHGPVAGHQRYRHGTTVMALVWRALESRAISSSRTPSCDERPGVSLVPTECHQTLSQAVGQGAQQSTSQHLLVITRNHGHRNKVSEVKVAGGEGQELLCRRNGQTIARGLGRWRTGPGACASVNDGMLLCLVATGTNIRGMHFQDRLRMASNAL